MSPLSWISLSPPSPSHCSRLLQRPSLSSMSHRANSHWLSFLHMVSMFPGYSFHTLWFDFSSFFFDWRQLSHIFCWTLMLITWDDKPSTSYSFIIRSRSPWSLFHFIFPTLLCLWETSFDLIDLKVLWHLISSRGSQKCRYIALRSPRFCRSERNFRGKSY